MENNRLIAEFMGYKIYEKRYPRNHGIGGTTLVLKDCILEKLKYHLSYDLLMPVFKKITELGYWYEITPGGCEIGENNKEYSIISCIGTTYPITSITYSFQAVVLFIKFYSQIKKNGKSKNKCGNL